MNRLFYLIIAFAAILSTACVHTAAVDPTAAPTALVAPEPTETPEPTYDPSSFIQEEYPSEWHDVIMDGDDVICRIDADVEYKPGPYMRCVIERETFDEETVAQIAEAFSPGTGFSDWLINKGHMAGGVWNPGGTKLNAYWLDMYIHFQCGEEMNCQEEKWLYRIGGFEGEPAPVFLQNVNISLEEAIEIGDKFLMEAGIQGYVCAYSDKARRIKENNETDCEGWKLYYEIDSGCVPFSASVVQPNQLLSIPRIECSSSLNDGFLTAFITEDGCKDFTWFKPKSVLTRMYVTEQLLPFSRIQSAFVSLLAEGISEIPRTEAETITATRIILSSLKINDPDDEDHAIETPVWILFITTDQWREERLSPFVLCIDAVTGERINPFNGLQ